MVYGHYDVQPPDPLEQWISPPFEPTARDGYLYARGSSDDKGQVFTHIKAVEAWLGALTREGLLAPGIKLGPDEFTAALYGFLAKTPCLLISVSLAEAAVERRAQNMPGTVTEYPNWRLPLCGPDGEPVLLEDLPSSTRVRMITAPVRGSGLA